MAKVQVLYICGCGFKTNDPSEASGHSDTRVHRMVVQGMVEPERKPSVSPRRPAPTPDYTPLSADSFKELRFKLQKSRGGN